MFDNLLRMFTGTGRGPFSGRWFTTYGEMALEQDGDHVRGAYSLGGRECTLEGRVEGGRLEFTYHEPSAAGEGWFALVRPGRFEGRWRAGAGPWLSWVGERGFEGVWDSTFGLLRLVHEPDGALGFYEGPGSSDLRGEVQDGRLVFRYREPNAAGEGHFTLADDGLSFDGEWRPDGSVSWRSWQGSRLGPAAGQTWLVVIEAHWQRHLLDREYSFGDMLRAFFARLDGVQFRHRFFGDEAGLRRWCRDLMYVPGPVIALIAAHATAEGVGVAGQTLPPGAVSEGLRYADNVRLLHFSSCLAMQEGPLLAELRGRVPFPLSGYTTSVDWGASALLEMTYLDLILGRGLSPADAAAQLPRLLNFAGDTTFEGSAYRAAGFRMVLPEGPERGASAP